MSTALIIIGALQHIGKPAPRCEAALVATREMWCSLAPRSTAVCPADAKLLALVAQSPTVWCTAELRVASPTILPLLRPGASEIFPQLRRIEMSINGLVSSEAATMMTFIGTMASSISEIVLTREIYVNDSVLQALEPLLGRLQVLDLQNCLRVTGDISTLLRGLTRLRLLQICCISNMTDDHLAATLMEAPMLESLALMETPRITGAFLATPADERSRHQHPYLTRLRELSLAVCVSFNDGGAAQIEQLRGLDTLRLRRCEAVTALRLTQLPYMRVVGRNFCCELSRLTTIDLAGMTQVVELGDYFLYYVTSLVTLSLSGLVNVKRVGEYFLGCSSKLVDVDVSAMVNVRHVGPNMLYGVRDLTRLRLSEGFLSSSSVSDVYKRLHAATIAAALDDS